MLIRVRGLVKETGAGEGAVQRASTAWQTVIPRGHLVREGAGESILDPGLTAIYFILKTTELMLEGKSGGKTVGRNTAFFSIL